jgi:hypothetical protein
MSLWNLGHWRPRIVSLLLTATVGASLLAGVIARPAAAEIPLGACTSYNVGEQDPETIGDGTEDYVIWECTKGKTTPIVYYWKLVDIRNVREDAEALREGIVKFVRTNVWIGLVTGGFGVFAATPYHRAHIRVVGAFDLRNWSGTPINRNMGIHMVLQSSHNGGATWASCADTGWKDASSATSKYSYEFYRLTSTCDGTIRLLTQAHFFQLSTNTWWTSSFVTAGPYTIISG